MEQQFFEELLAILGMAIVVTVLLRRLQLPSIISYLLAGVLIGPSLLGLVDDPQHFELLAEFGVVFLLFSLGLEFSLPKMIGLRKAVFGLGGIQVCSCMLIFLLAVWFWGDDLQSAFLIAGALALSSTAIVSKELSTLGQVHSRHGQLSIGVLLFQDLAAVVLLIMVPVMAGSGDTSMAQALGWALLKGTLLIVLLLSIGKWLLPPLYREIACARSDEIFVLSTLVIAMLAAWVTHYFHLSMALGGFVIGMMLGDSPFRHQISSDIRPFKDVLLGLFFVTIGMNIELGILQEHWLRILLFALLLMLIKTLIISLLVRLMGDNRQVALQTSLNLAQAGEFGLALLALGVMHGLLDSDQSSFIILVLVLSMAASPFLIRHGHRISQFLERHLWRTPLEEEEEDDSYLPQGQHVIVGGYGRVGRTITRLLEANNIDYIVIENDVNVVNRCRRDNRNIIYGDCTKPEILENCHLSTSMMAVLTFRSMEQAKHSIEHIRANGISVPIIVRCSEHGDVEELVSMGADHVVPEMLEASLVIGTQMLSILNISQPMIDDQITQERSFQLKKN